jgi:hypothetical protein
VTEEPFDPLKRCERASSEFGRSAQASAKRFRCHIQRALKKMRMGEDIAKVEMERAKTEFEADLDAARAKLQARLSQIAVLHPIPSAKVDDGFEFVKAEFEAELDRARATFKGNRQSERTDDKGGVDQDAHNIERTLEELGRAREELRAARTKRLVGPRGWRKIAPLKLRVERLAMEAIRKPPKHRRRRPDDDGGELAPVKPRPNPTPLMDGAEAPIE